jgi:hypothetical protein
MKPVLKLLRDAKKKIGTPETWCKGYFAKDDEGYNVNSLHNKAVRWCSIGAINFCSYDGEDTVRACKYLAQSLYTVLDTYMGIQSFNDDENTTHKDVMQAFNRAIKLAQKESK